MFQYVVEATKHLTTVQVTCPLRSQVENLRYGDCVSVDLLLDTESVLSQLVSQSILTTSAEGMGYLEHSVTLRSSK